MFGQFTVANNVRVELASSINSVVTTITVNEAASPFNNPPDPTSAFSDDTSVATLMDSLTDPTKIEIITYKTLVDNGDGTFDLEDVSRGQQGTSAQSFSAGAFLVQSMTAAMTSHPDIYINKTTNALYAASLNASFNDVTAFGNFTLHGTFTAGQVIARANLTNGAACSVIGRSANSSGVVADISAASDNMCLIRSGGSLSFNKLPVEAISASGLASGAVLRGDGTWATGVGGSWSVGNALTVGSGGLSVSGGTITFPSNSIARAALVNGSAKSVIGRSANSTGVVADIAGSAARQALMVDSSNANIGFRAFELADLPNAGLSVLARTANSSGARTNLAPTTPAGGGDVMFVENATLVFDNWIRQRRNIMRGFWEFENGAAGWVASGDTIRGTPFVGTVTGTATINHADRSSAYTRNCITLINYTASSKAAITFGDVVAMSNGLPTGVGPLIFEGSININALSTASDEYALNIGFVSDDALADDGVFFQYQRTSSVNWRLIARNGGTTTVTTSGTAVSATSVRLRIEITASNLATFYVNGTSVGTVTSNIPARVGIGWVQEKTASTGAPTFNDCDYMAYQLALTTPRSASQR